MKKIYFLVVFILGGIHFSFGQEEVKNELNLILPSSTSYSLGSYGQHSIGMFTGTVQEQIELYNYKVKDLAVPITLSYSSNGIKVDQAENNVGIGWVLNAGGVITRVVNGKADERRSNKLPPDAHCDDQEMVNYVYHNSRTGLLDTEPDLFLFNFLGRSGQFTLDDNKQVLLLKQEDLEIKMLKGTDQNYYFTVRDEQGITYVFDQREVTTTEYDYSYDSAVTAWYLKSITSPKGTVVYFEYTDDHFSYLQQASHSIKKIKIENTCSNNSGAPKEKWEYAMNTVYTNMKTAVLSRIYSNNPYYGEVLFKQEYSRPHFDHLKGEPKLISAVIVQNQARQTVEHIKLDYVSTRNRRTFLNKVQFLAPNHQYEFEYYNPEGLNERFGSKDAWGYNSRDRGDFPDPISNWMLIKDRNLGYEKHPQVSVGNKYTDTYAIVAGLLKKIIFPTKGYTTFSYQPNSVVDGELIPAKYGIASMSLMYGSRPEPVYFKTLDEYTVEAELSLGFYDPNYNPGGAEYPIDQEGYYFNLMKESPKGSGRYVQAYSRLTTEKVHQLVVRKLQVDPFAKYKLEGFYTGFKNDRVGVIGIKYKASNDTIVEKELALNGVSVSSIESYTADDELALKKRYSYLDLDTGSSSGSNYFDTYVYVARGEELTLCNTGGMFPLPIYNPSITVFSNSLLSLNDPIGDGRVAYGSVVEQIQYGDSSSSMTQYKYYLDHGMMGFSCITNGFSGPPKWTRSNWHHGLLSEKHVFNEKKEKVLSEVYTYEEDQSKRLLVRGLSSRIKYMSTTGYTNDGANINPLNIKHIGYTKYEINSFRNYLKSVTSTKYEGTKSIEEKQTFAYTSPYHYQKTQTTIETPTATIVERYFYPDDVVSQVSLPGDVLSADVYQGISKLKKQNDHSPAQLIQTGIYKDNTWQGSTRNIYKLWNNKALFTTQVVSKGEQSFFPSNLAVTYYDRHFNVQEIEDKSGSKTVYLYGYGQTLLIARIENATKEQVASALGVSIANLVTINETKLTQLNNLRTNAALKEALITTYEHKPLVGITKMTDSKGTSMSYEYDLFNRLKAIKDNEGNIIEEYEYNYKNNQ
ncbi:hypothetical protein [Myroides odoratus]|uniref:hypothetical protein n=1 Tax=Myroides odoratus TaxID=256 RepID=UPI000765F9E0|nr:hypothetical protein [Myroides odoratus]